MKEIDLFYWISIENMYGNIKESKDVTNECVQKIGSFELSLLLSYVWKKSGIPSF